MPIMRDMVDKADFERMEQGLPVRKKPKRQFTDPEQPSVKGQIKGDSVPAKDLESITGKRRNVHSRDGVTFIGYDVSVQVKDKKPITGWMTDGDLVKLRQSIRGRKDVEVQVAE